MVNSWSNLLELAKTRARIGHVSISHWSEFMRILRDSVQSKAGWQWAFRGQRDSTWGLASSLEREIRLLQNEKSRLFWNRGVSSLREFLQKGERRQIEEFQQTARVGAFAPSAFSASSIESPVDCLAILQHYGAKTRLLDFTYSLSVAAAFAYEERWTDAPRSIWAINLDLLITRIPKILEDLFSRQAMMDKASKSTRSSVTNWPSDSSHVFAPYFRNFANRHIEDPLTEQSGVIPICLTGNNSRLMAQSGMFLFPLSFGTFENNLVNILGCSSEEFKQLMKPDKKQETVLRGSIFRDYTLLKIDLAPQMEDEAWDVLDQLHVNPRQLFPDLDGLAKSMRIKF